MSFTEWHSTGPSLGRQNSWGHNVTEQAGQTFTGMGFDINVHDQWAIESQGRIQDRTREHLGTTDKAIVAYRRMLLSAIGQVANGEKPPMWLDPGRAGAIRGPIAIDGMGPTEGWQSYWKDVDGRRRRDHAARSHDLPRAAVGTAFRLDAVRHIFHRRPPDAALHAAHLPERAADAGRARLRFRRRPRSRVPSLQAGEGEAWHWGFRPARRTARRVPA